MSKIKNGGLHQYGAKPIEQQQFATAGVEGVNSSSVFEDVNAAAVVCLRVWLNERIEHIIAQLTLHRPCECATFLVVDKTSSSTSRRSMCIVGLWL